MRKIDIYPKAVRFLAIIPEKHKRQITSKIYQLAENPRPHDSKKLAGFIHFSASCGEYRIIYKFTEALIQVVIIGKRNDDEVYKQLTRH